MAREVRLPELGEGIEHADVVRVLVAPGDTVEVDQPLLEIETDKATVEVPSPTAGTVTTIAVQAGATIAVGQLIVSLEAGGPAGTPAGHPLGSGPVPTEAATPPSAPAAASPAPTVPTGGPTRVPTHTAQPEPPATPVPPRRRPARSALAAPSVRKLAREIGVDIDGVTGSGTSGRVSLDDVKAHARRAMEQHRTGTAPTSGPALQIGRAAWRERV